MDLASFEPSAHYIAFAHVYKAFERPALVDCSFSLDAGSVLAVAGPPGSGKSLILQLIMGFERPDRGKVASAHETVESAEDWERIRRKIVMISQSTMLLESLTVKQNVAYFMQLREDYDEGNKALVADGLLQMGDLALERDLRPCDLPAAQRRMLALLQIFGSQPQCILFDQPTAALDPRRSESLREVMLRVKKQLGMTMLVATEDLDFIHQIADQVLLLDRGETVFFGNCSEFFASDDARVQRYLRMEPA